jgi:hypothetical protein
MLSDHDDKATFVYIIDQCSFASTRACSVLPVGQNVLCHRRREEMFDEVEMTVLTDGLVDVVQETLQLAQASLWRREPTSRR